MSPLMVHSRCSSCCVSSCLFGGWVHNPEGKPSRIREGIFCLFETSAFCPPIIHRLFHITYTTYGRIPRSSQLEHRNHVGDISLWCSEWSTHSLPLPHASSSHRYGNRIPCKFRLYAKASYGSRTPGTHTRRK